MMCGEGLPKTFELYNKDIKGHQNLVRLALSNV
jgi:hypothetical protein